MYTQKCRHHTQRARMTNWPHAPGASWNRATELGDEAVEGIESIRHVARHETASSSPLYYCMLYTPPEPCCFSSHWHISGSTSGTNVEHNAQKVSQASKARVFHYSLFPKYGVTLARSERDCLSTHSSRTRQSNVKGPPWLLMPQLRCELHFSCVSRIWIIFIYHLRSLISHSSILGLQSKVRTYVPFLARYFSVLYTVD